VFLVQFLQRIIFFHKILQFTFVELLDLALLLPEEAHPLNQSFDLLGFVAFRTE